MPKNQNKEIMIFYRKINWDVEFRRMKGTTPFKVRGGKHSVSSKLMTNI